MVTILIKKNCEKLVSQFPKIAFSISEYRQFVKGTFAGIISAISTFYKS